MLKVTFTKSNLINLIKVSELIDAMLYFAIDKHGKLTLKSQSRSSVILIAEREDFFKVEKWEDIEDEIHFYFIDANSLRKKLTLLSNDITLEATTDEEVAVETTFKDNKFKIVTRNMNTDMLEEDDDIRYNPSREVIKNLTEGYNSCISLPKEEMKEIKKILGSVTDDQCTISINTDEAIMKSGEVQYILGGEINEDSEDISVTLKNAIINKLNVDIDINICINDDAVMFQTDEMTVIAASEID